MQPEKADGVHGDGLVEGLFAAGHVDAGRLPLQVGVRQDGENPVRTGGDVAAFAAVARGVQIRHAGRGAAVDGDAAPHPAAGPGGEPGVRPNADGDHQHVKRDFPAAFQQSGTPREAGHAVAQRKPDALFFEVPAHDGRAFGVEDARQDAVGQIDDRNGLDAAADPLGALEADQPGADNQHAGLFRKGGPQRLRVVQLHEAELFLHGFQPFHRRHKRMRAGGEQQPVERDLLPGFKRDRLPPGVHADGLSSQQDLHAVLPVKIVRAVLHVFLVRLPAQQV